MRATLLDPVRRPPSLLARRNPTVKLVLVLATSLVLLFVLDPVTPAVLYLLALLAVATAAGTRPRTLALAHLPFLGFAVGLVVVNALSRPGEVLLRAGVLRVTVEGLEVGTALGLRTLVIGVLAIGFLASTPAVTLMTSLREDARLSPRVAFALLAGHRMLQEMPREWETLRQAQAVREPGVRPGHLPRRPAVLARAALGLLVVSVRKGERMAQSLESRGLGLAPRSTWRPAPRGPGDLLMVLVVVTVVAGVLLASARLGHLQGFGALGSG